ncbi:MAG TPA: hypothetical protein VE545_02510 [Candidatus Dormibacteraeota bacterium]|nr:hypothetical protein [Candidatus Dormibacteraeota bacterium]
MNKLAALTLSLFLVCGTAFADTPKDSDAPPAKPKPPAAAKSEDKSNSAIAAEIEALRQSLESQQEQLQLLKEELAKRDRQIDEAREEAASANARASEASSKAIEAVAASADAKSSTVALNSSVTALKTTTDAIALTTAPGNSGASQLQNSDDGPAAIRYKGITLTPGGFLAAESSSRNRATGSDVNTAFTGIPYNGNALAHVSENNFSGRQSRISLLAQGKIGSATAGGYYEADFLSAGTTSNNRQSNSYTLRQRQLFAQVAFDSGWIITGGQQWSLATETKKGLFNRQENLPQTIDAQYNVGFTWARQYGFRLVKDFGGKFALGLSIEGPQATIGGRGFSSVTTINNGAAPSVIQTTGATSATTGNFFLNAPGAGGGLLNAFDSTGYSVNKAPDFVFKAAADPGFGHFEVFGIVSVFRNRIYPCGVVGTNAGDTVATPIVTPTTLGCAAQATFTPSAAGAFNDTRTGGGIGASGFVSVLHKKVDLGLKVVGGDGIGRYGSAQLADATARPDGSLALIRTGHGLARAEFHPTKKLDLYLYYGGEYAWRASYLGYNAITVTRTAAIPSNGTSPAIPATTTTAFALNRIGGYGSPFANNSGCSVQAPPINQLNPSAGGTCAGDIRLIQEGTAGFWYRFYQGSKGRVQFGVQYSYITRQGYSGNNTATGVIGAATLPGASPKANDNMVFTSFRYYLP